MSHVLVIRCIDAVVVVVVVVVVEGEVHHRILYVYYIHEEFYDALHLLLFIK